MKILISGAGIAGLTLAHLLAEQRHDVTIVERAGTPRSSGNPVDVRGDAMRVAEHIGIADKLRAAATSVTTFRFVDDDGATIAYMRNVSNNGSDDIEIARGDLAAILLQALPNEVNLIEGDSISALRETGGTVAVSFERGERSTYDLVVGTDGLHSRVRRLAFGDESRFVRRHGLYIATAKSERTVTDLATVRIHNSPGTAVISHPGRGRELAMFLLRSRNDIDVRNPAAYRAFVATKLKDRSGTDHALAEAFLERDDVYFDAVSSVHLDTWSTHRTTLLGDAASSASIFGEGSSLAMVGAQTLASALAATTALPSALAAYERTHRPRVLPRINGIDSSARFMVPATRAQLTARNLGLRLRS